MSFLIGLLLVAGFISILAYVISITYVTIKVALQTLSTRTLLIIASAAIADVVLAYYYWTGFVLITFTAWAVYSWRTAK